ncbi:MAG TPA: hypothetical protein VK550_18940 [Polyangiaceae bacterium]|nr:hypothetical protein [Polyangiaceae bacterium]
MQEVDFYELSRAVQERFVACVGGQGQPAPVLQATAGQPRGMLASLGIAAASVALLLGLYQVGLGNLDSGLALHSTAFIAGYGFLLAAILVAFLQVFSRLKARQSLPFVAGIYLFPSGVIDARSYKLRVFPFTSKVPPVVSGENLVLAFPEATFTFPVAAGHLEQAKGVVEEAESRVERAAAEDDKKTLGLLDPLVDVGVANPFAPKTRMVRQVPVWARHGILIGIAMGAALAPGVWWLRNRASDEGMLSVAHRQRSVAGYQAYLARGGRRDEVRDVFLPRIELRDAVKEGTVEAVERYIAAHPNSGIQTEVTAALRQAMLIALESVKKTGTVSALAEFGKKHPHKLIDTELRQAIHAVYQGALAKYRKEASARDPTVVAFVERLLAVAEKSGPKVDIRFRRKVTRTMEMADNQIKRSPFYMGVVSLPSQYFDDAHARGREEAAAKAIAARFAASFPPDILTLEMGAPLADPDAPLPATTTIPTVFIEHISQVSGPSYLTARPRGVFVGLALIFEATFRLPDDTKPLHFKLPTWRNPDAKVEKGDGALEPAVYEAMTSAAFAQFTNKYLATFFNKPEVPTAAGDTKPASVPPDTKPAAAPPDAKPSE